MRRVAGWIVCCVLLWAAEARAEPHWVWSSEAADLKEPIGTCYFRKVFEVTDVSSGRIEITADNQYELFVNGRRVGAGQAWQVLDVYDVKRNLRGGKNVIAVVVKNTDGPGGLVARVHVQSSWQAVNACTDKTWKASLQEARGWEAPDFDDSQWKPVHVYGRLGPTAPWGQTTRVAAGSERPQFGPNVRPPGKFQLIDGDRVIWLGDTLIERAQDNDYLEARLTRRTPGKSVIFRNLGWSGDTVLCDARAGFGTAADGFRQLKQQVYDLKPTVAVLGYGGASSSGGPSEVPAFLSGLDVLLEMLAPTHAQFVFLSPLRHERLPPPLPDPSEDNVSRQAYANALKSAALERQCPFVDLFDLLSAPAASEAHLTDNGIHLTSGGYWQASQVIEQALLDELAPSVIRIDTQGLTAAETTISAAAGGGPTIGPVRRVGDGLEFSVRLPALPPPAMPHGRTQTAIPKGPAACIVRIAGLADGTHALQIDGTEVARGQKSDWERGLAVERGPDFDQVEELRKTIVHKNRLYFYRWRPQNETYLLGFRKHEQGQNAREIPMFDPLITEQESIIDRLKQPLEHKYQLVRITN